MQRWPVPVAALVAALCWCSPPTAAQEQDDDGFVGWPLTKQEKQALERSQDAPPPPQRSQVTDKALEAWPTDEDRASQNGSRALTTPPEIAPLNRFTPEFEPRRIVYEGYDFALTLATSELLDMIAMRLRETGENIRITAHSTTAQISTHEAVKLSFKRAMLIRLYLLDEGVRADQIELRALPDAPDGGPTDRVDITPATD